MAQTIFHKSSGNTATRHAAMLGEVVPNGLNIAGNLDQPRWYISSSIAHRLRDKASRRTTYIANLRNITKSIERDHTILETDTNSWQVQEPTLMANPPQALTQIFQNCERSTNTTQAKPDSFKTSRNRTLSKEAATTGTGCPSEKRAMFNSDRLSASRHQWQGQSQTLYHCFLRNCGSTLHEHHDRDSNGQYTSRRSVKNAGPS